MDRDIIRACLWQEVTRLGFNPAGDKERKKWLRLYNQSLAGFWELGDYPAMPKVDDKALRGDIYPGFNMNVVCEYSVYEPEKFIVKFLEGSNNDYKLMWLHDVDGKYFNFPNQPVLNKLSDPGKRSRALREEAKKHDMEAVIDGLICHPRTHQHIKESKTEDKNDLLLKAHAIRIGGGIDNAFLFLFHLRYQLCLIKEKRIAERERLIDLFFDAIKNKADHRVNPLPVFKLMAQP